MRRTARAQRESLNRLARENEEQRDTILRLWEALSLPGSPFPSFQHSSAQSEQAPTRLQDPQNQRIAELEAVLEQKSLAFRKLEDQVAEYVRHAEEYEEELRRNEQEKVQLLDHFRNVAGDSALTLDELEGPPAFVAALKSGRSPRPPQLHEILAEKIMTVETLRVRLEDHNKLIRNLREDNQLLRNALSAGTSISTSGTFTRSVAPSNGSNARMRMV
jgi:hypothetical protein